MSNDSVHNRNNISQIGTLLNVTCSPSSVGDTILVRFSTGSNYSTHAGGVTLPVSSSYASEGWIPELKILFSGRYRYILPEPEAGQSGDDECSTSQSHFAFPARHGGCLQITQLVILN
jgi:hypothetical protein